MAAASIDGGALSLVFDNRASLRCEPDPEFEAWQVVGGRPQYLVVCQPGGELAIWDERHVPSREEAQESVQRLFGDDWCLRAVTERGGIVVEPKPSSDD